MNQSSPLKRGEDLKTNIMKEKINELKEAFCNAKTENERKAIDRQMKELLHQNPDQFAEAMAESAKESADRATALAMKQKLADIRPAISWVHIARKYFNKTDSWLYQRINGNTVNGKPASFTPAELDTLKHALGDLSKKLGSLSASL
jgi:predicted Zn-dependent peptidase